MLELGSALHVLNDPAHHHASAWAETVLGSMSPPLADATRTWAWTSQAIRAEPFVAATTGRRSFTDLLEQMREAPPARLAKQLLRPISPTGDRQIAVRWSQSRGPHVQKQVETLVSRPALGVHEFLTFLADSWDEWFSLQWKSLQPRLAGRSSRFTRALARSDVASAIASLHPAIQRGATNDRVTIAKVQSARHDVAHRGLVVAPSAFIAPHLYVANVARRPLLLIYPMQESAPVPPVPAVMNQLSALARPGRLEVARAIATEPRTAGEIAQLWHTDPTMVNRHLRALAAAGFARTTRRGRFVQYSLVGDGVSALGDEVLALLLR